ncbi:MAG: CBS domain-containing protein [Verrucomicrobia bacterium]|nr:CBS domain-containing protein [Verrucomicrobiota bacterium]
MKWAFTICKVFGIRIRLHATFLLLVLWVMWAAYMDAGAAGAWWGLVFVAAAFACVALHELGHSVVAQRLGVRVSAITLLPIGGVAALRSIPEKPAHEIAITVAGPLVNVAIFGMLYVVGYYAPFDVPYYPGLVGFPGLPMSLAELIGALLSVNKLMVVFNLVPAYPMDGGRLLRATLASMIPFPRATSVAAKIGRTIAMSTVIACLLVPDRVEAYLGTSPLMLGIIGLMIFLAAGSEAQAIRLRGMLRGATVGQVMNPEFVRVTPDETAADCFRKIYRTSQDDFPVMTDGQLLGLLTREDVLEAMRQSGGPARAGDLMQTCFHSLRPDVALEVAHEQMQAGRQRTFPVVCDGALVGLLTAENVQRYFAAQMELVNGGRRSK